MTLVHAGNLKTVRAQALHINRKNIYRTSLLEIKDTRLKQIITDTHQRHPAYGHKRLAIELRINHKRILRIMNKFDIKPPRRKVNHYCTKSTTRRLYDNLIKTYKPYKAHECWCSDISYLKFKGVFWYLATIVDVYTRQVVSARIGKKHDSNLVVATIQEAILYVKQIPIIFHTDQGTEFMAKKCTTYLERLGVRISVSDTASPWQNGYQESFFGKLKDEMGDINRFETIGELIEEIYLHIYYYNNHRIHTALKMPPAVYAKQHS